MIRLRDTTSSDLDFVLKAEQAAENRPFIVQWTREEHKAAISSPDMAHFILEHTATGAPVGYAILVGLQNRHQSLCLQRLVVTEKGQGHGRQALRLIKQRAFDTFHAHRLWLDVRVDNRRAQALYTSEGFRMEGTLRDCHKVDDHFVTVMVMALLQAEYQMV